MKSKHKLYSGDEIIETKFSLKICLEILVLIIMFGSQFMYDTVLLFYGLKTIYIFKSIVYWLYEKFKTKLLYKNVESIFVQTSLQVMTNVGFF